MAATSQFALATHLMACIARWTGRGPEVVLSRNGYARGAKIAASVNTNPVVIRRISARLIKAGLVLSHRGKGGGLELAQPAEKITLYDIYVASEPTVFAPNPRSPYARCIVSRNMPELMAGVFASVDDGIEERLSRIRLADLIRQIK